MIHNRHLPRSLHRFCNAVLGFFGVATASLWLNACLPPRFQTIGLIAAGILTVAATCTLAIVNPKRFSVVEGIAGEAGYDELTEDERAENQTDIAVAELGGLGEFGCVQNTDWLPKVVPIAFRFVQDSPGEFRLVPGRPGDCADRQCVRWGAPGCHVPAPENRDAGRWHLLKRRGQGRKPCILQRRLFSYGCLSFAIDHSLIVVSSEPVASVLLSGEKARPSQVLKCARYECTRARGDTE